MRRPRDDDRPWWNVPGWVIAAAGVAGTLFAAGEGWLR